MNELLTVSFNTNFLRESAEGLARIHQVQNGYFKVKSIQPILLESKTTLTSTYRALSKIVKSEKEVTPAAEWLLDNFYLIQEQIVQVGIDFPPAFQKNTPMIRLGEHEGMPRVYEIILNMLMHTDNVLDQEMLKEYVSSYQKIEILQLGELWAIPIMIRLFLIQILAEKAARILEQKNIIIEVENFLIALRKKDLQEPGSFSHSISKWAKVHVGKSGLSYLVELYRQLQSSGLLHEEQKRWFNFHINQYEVTIEEAMHQEAQRQSRLQVTIQNAVLSLRHAAEMEWADFVEDSSILNAILKEDPSGDYSMMDFHSRDSYRKVIEKISRGSFYSETEVAREALTLAQARAAAASGKDDNFVFDENCAKQHIGYFLMGDGYEELSRKAGYQAPLFERINKAFEQHFGLYLLSVAFIAVLLITTLGLTVDILSYSYALISALILIAVFPAVDLAISVVNRFFAFFLPPRVLPKMDHKKDVPDSSRTLVVMPTLFSNAADAIRQIDNLEVQYLANPDSGLQFAILSDFRDAATEQLSGDEDILSAAAATINALNAKYSSRYGDKFFMLHRRRRWNESEKVWMGWERKRGKLEELNTLICDPSSANPFFHIAGKFLPSIASHPIQFVITLDADTKLPPGSAKKLINTIAHPLNRAWYDKDKMRITKGYTIIQPRISFFPESAKKTWFSKIFSGNVGIDSYSAAVSDIYQDLTGEAIFTGKGIYDVKAFHCVLHNRLPINRILSHDLIESSYLRTGLATDIELFDDYPSTYQTFTKRNHRWTRGDWQIASWLFSTVPGKQEKKKNPINLLSKWKIIDNLRRSLNFLFLMVFFIVGLFWFPGAAWIWIMTVFGIVAFSTYVSLSSDLLNRPARVRWKIHMIKVRENLRINIVQAVSTVIILPHQAFIQLDAIIRTIYRLTISKKCLLEWSTASQEEQQDASSLKTYFKMMILPILLGITIFIIAWVKGGVYLYVITPFFLLWLSSPFFVWYISLPIRKKKQLLSEEDRQKLRLYARRTWFYFERFVNEDNNWLPPDNYQEEPNLAVANRTSPTNIGLALAANQTAYHMGYIGLGQLLHRQQKSLEALQRLEKYNGHLFNWYATDDGRLLQPRYISTVDSGNLAASLIIAKEAMKTVMQSPQMNPNSRKGLIDTLQTIDEIFTDLLRNEDTSNRAAFSKALQISQDLLLRVQAMTDSSLSDESSLRELHQDAKLLSTVPLVGLGNKQDDRMIETLIFWISAPLRQLDSILEDRDYFEVYQIADTQEEVVALGGKSNVAAGALMAPHPTLNPWQSQAAAIVRLAGDMIDKMNFSFLFLRERGLFSIGYNLDTAQFDKSTYDLLASEARIASYVAIAKGDVPVAHWFRMSRRLTAINGEETLLSWGGTMFEYLMPRLFLLPYSDTLMSHTYQNVIDWQKIYGDSRRLPWGFSESAYYFLNIDLHYQYRTFGAPGLGLKRGLADEYVVAPYASLLALMVDAKSSIQNLQAIEKVGGLGLMGFYDAIDYTPTHLNEYERFKLVKTYMVHHHGMGLMALDNLLNDNILANIFHQDPRIKGCELLLQEKIPRGAPIKEPYPIDAELEPRIDSNAQYIAEHAGMDELDLSPPRLHTLSNGSFSSMLTHAGTGVSKCQDIVLNGWKSDPTIDPLGLFFYIKDLESDQFWSAMHQPVKAKPDRYDTWFHNGKIVCSRVDQWIETTTEICVSPDFPIELRKLSLTNYSDRERKLEITSYAEVVLNKMADHSAHPAFSKLFVETEYLPEYHAIIAKRRARSKEEKPIWMIHTFASTIQESDASPLTFDTERSNFIGKGRSLSHPEAMDAGYQMKQRQGNVSDPIFSFRKELSIQAGEKISLTFGLGFANSREEAIQTANMYDNQLAVNRAFDLAAIYGTVELNHLGIKTKQAHFFQKLAAYLFYPSADFRADQTTQRLNRKKQEDLWAYGISGDFPLLVFRITESSQLKHIKLLLKAHSFWRNRGIASELLIINDHAPGYIDEIRDSIQQAIESSLERDVYNKRGGVFVFRSDNIKHEDKILLMSVASAIFHQQLPDFEKSPKKLTTTSWYKGGDVSTFSPLIPTQGTSNSLEEKQAKLHFFNGYGGFSADGKQYHILGRPYPAEGRPLLPPLPWINVIANERFGFTVSDRGAGYSWSENSRENKLTTWSNDPVLDTHSEAFYIRDEQRRKYWSPCPGPVAAAGDYEVIHGFGFSSFHLKTDDIEQQLLQFVPRTDSIKISRLSIQNHSQERKRLSVFRYLDRVLGVDRAQSARFVHQQLAKGSDSLLAHNHYNNEFAGRIVFSSLINPLEGASFHHTTDRQGFIGRNRSLNRPLAVTAQEQLDDRIIAGGDACAALQSCFELDPGESVSLLFLEGECPTAEETEKLIARYADPEQVENALQEVHRFWEKSLSRVKISTPDPSMDFMVNGWLVYQNLSCRMWARTGFYQSGGAYGFRDQLQDATAASYVDAGICRQQILKHAAQQFPEGDVLHWWHPPTGRGIRSKITDDRLWLPYVLDFYLKATGDFSLLDEQVAFINARPLETHEHEAYLHPTTSGEQGSIYDHCCKAIDISLQFGRHGLPLMGGGDWNDGMNRVGEKDEGESVWLGFFLYHILTRFEKICRQMKEPDRADHYLATAQQLKMKLNSEGWDGKWYLRAFYDDGTPIGSSENEECSIDAISQAWAVFSGVASPERGKEALLAVEEHLISEKDQIIRLLTPPFDKTDQDPGYIKGYIPGVRENGGQYTHAALWTVKAFAELGMGEKAVKYFNMINPINHGSSFAAANVYQVEPYVVAADIYGEDLLTGQGGWSWYTGSAGWMYRVALESVLGLQIQQDVLYLRPAISEKWEEYRVDLLLDDDVTRYELIISNPLRLQSGLLSGSIDGKAVHFSAPTARIPILKDGQQHHVLLVLRALREGETTAKEAAND
ncbi:MAG: hypothetical protein LAT68_11595 [Cyclobacteriaceae bacterium]|nr:hypothetical protein [Cyclobacteriaceae bacterium]MCH8516960.1 hypothetical protein [Cyclobacteriaceae bacterium]